MDTKRCLRCHKLLRADAQKCSLCGYLFLQMPVRRNSKTTNGSRYSATASFPSNSPASPHRAGHYSGLHPEDQPYQSSFMPILRPAAITRRLNEPDSEEMLETRAVSSVPSQDVHEAERKQTSKRYVASPVSITLPMPQRSPGVLSQKVTPASLLEVDSIQLVPESTLHEQITAQLPLHVTDKRQRRSPLARILFIATILSFLVASSILTYLILFTRTGAPVHPTAKVIHTGSQQGQFSAPQLQLSATDIDFGAVNVQNSLTLTNIGDQQVNWQAGVDSHSSWLGISPTFGIFSKKETATVMVNRSNLAPQAYTGYIHFFQQGTNNPLTLKVTMSVTTLSAPVSVSPAKIACKLSSTVTNSTQQLQITNSGSATLNWTFLPQSLPAWLSVDTTSGTLPPGYIAFVNVACNNAALQAGSYTYTLVVSDTGAQTPVTPQNVQVTLTVT